MTFLKCIIFYPCHHLIRRKIFHFWCFYIDNPLNKAASRESRLYILDWHQCQDGNEDKLKTFPPHLDSSFVLFKFLTDCFDVLYVMPHSVSVYTLKMGKWRNSSTVFIKHYRFFSTFFGGSMWKKNTRIWGKHHHNLPWQLTKLIVLRILEHHVVIQKWILRRSSFLLSFLRHSCLIWLCTCQVFKRYMKD